jgi:4-methyl-5(b-hydroxyethyl)-thiazole monophosphate biosynthesis
MPGPRAIRGFWPMNPRVLCLAVTGFEEIEMIAPVDLLRRAGAEVVIASVDGERLVKGRCGVVVQADAALADVPETGWDLVLIPGGPGVKALREDGRAARLARAQSEAGRPVAAICAAPTVLKDAGLLSGRRYTAHFSVKDELPGILADERVVEDGHVITSRGAGTAVDFGLALVRRLFDAAKADEVARAIMA